MTNDLSQYETAVLKVRERKTVSTAALMRILSHSEFHENLYGSAWIFIDRMVRDGIITAPLANGTRKVISPIKKPKPKFTPEDYLSSG